jgi:hypothetical protein
LSENVNLSLSNVVGFVGAGMKDLHDRRKDFIGSRRRRGAGRKQTFVEREGIEGGKGVYGMKNLLKSVGAMSLQCHRKSPS